MQLWKSSIFYYIFEWIWMWNHIIVNSFHSRLSLFLHKGCDGSELQTRHRRWNLVTSRCILSICASSWAFVMSICGFLLNICQSHGPPGGSGFARIVSHLLDLFMLNASQFQGLSGFAFTTSHVIDEFRLKAYQFQNPPGGSGFAWTTSHVIDGFALNFS